MSARDNYYVLKHLGVRQLAARRCIEVPDFWSVAFKKPVKTRPQEEKYHAQIRDISEQCEFMGRMWDEADWKRLLIDAFGRIKAEEGDPLPGWNKFAPSLDGSGFVQLAISSTTFDKEIASEFIEYLYAYGSESGVAWSEKAQPEWG